MLPSNENSPGMPVQTTLEIFLAELSAGDTDVDREGLQKTLERLQVKIDRAADRLTTPPPL